jgi:gliding motility-associated-like protein
MQYFHTFHKFIRTSLSLVVMSGFFAGTVPFAHGQLSPPQLRCISVESNGSVTLTWLAGADTGNVFGGYHIYGSSSVIGPYSPVDSIFNYNTLTVNLSSINATNTIWYFYIRTREGCCATYSGPSDTLRSMRMIVSPLSNEHVRLNWNRIHTPPLPSTTLTFTLSKELVTGSFTPFASVMDTTTLDTNYYCSRFINYRVIQGDVSGCVSVSSIDGELFRDTRGPALPLIDTVSINPLTGNPVITWFPDSSSDTQGYVIYLFNGTSYDSIGAVLGINTLSWEYTLSNAENTVETFSVAAFDSCKNLSPLATVHKTLLLKSVFSKCDSKASLTWTPYINMAGGNSRYEIWVRENAGVWIRHGFVPPTVLTYDVPLTSPGADYEFFIRVVGGTGKTASSNIRSVFADIFVPPSFMYIRSASVSGSAVTVRLYVDPAGDTKSYTLYRGTTFNGAMAPVATINYSPSSDIIFTDVFADADLGARYYRVKALDSCGTELSETQLTATVFLTGEGGNDYTSRLSWTSYIGWNQIPGSYKIYRVVNGVRAGTPFVSVAGDTISFEEDVSNIQIPGGNLCYVIQASEDSVNIFGFSDSAFSNIACAPQAASEFIPNAFTPGGKNPVFIPYLLFDDPSTYSLRIFNRWGQMVFESETPQLGWNGRFQEQDSPAGVYIYHLVFRGLNKKEIRRMGTLSLIR